MKSMEKWKKNGVVGIAKIEQIRNKSEIEKALTNMLNYMKEKGKIEIPDRAKIMVKPNICYVQGYETGTTVDPFIVKCLVEWLLKNHDVENIIIGEADATELNVDVAFKVLGWEDLFKPFPKVHLLNLTKDERVRIRLDGMYFKELGMSMKYMESDFLISVAKLKTHSMCKITCILKNQFGANPIKNKSRYHKQMDEVIHDLNKVRLPELCIVDGIIGMEGNGPIGGLPKPAGVLIVGDDPVATDHVCAKIVGINPIKIPYLKLAIEQKLGSSEYEIFGGNIEDIKTKFKCGTPLWKRTIKGFYSLLNHILL